MPGRPHGAGHASAQRYSWSNTKGTCVATIVCGIDDSPGALEAVRVASTLSARFEARLVLAHVANGWAVGSDESVTTNQGRQGGQRLLERAAREHNPAAERRVEVGEPAEALARIASEEAATLIVVGSRPHGWRRPRFRSRLAGDLAATAPCPVVVVPPPARR
jgi:nucleotide-binding universal stress UspA family protein